MGSGRRTQRNDPILSHTMINVDVVVLGLPKIAKPVNLTVSVRCCRTPATGHCRFPRSTCRCTIRQLSSMRPTLTAQVTLSTCGYSATRCH